jgi:AhpD family alkylhydroperoxidase
MSRDIPRRCVVVLVEHTTIKENTMDARLDIMTNDTAMKAVKHFVSAGKAAAGSLPAATQELVKIRASQINGCGFCLDMHTKDARLNGETEQRLYLLSAWREAPMYSERERAALAWAEAVTKLENGEVPDEVYAQAREHFDEQQLMKLTLQIVAINGWNRFCISFNAEPGTYKAGSLSKSGVAQTV